MNVKTSINLNDKVIDEVALEGLDGITLEALWQRLAIKLGESLPFANSLMVQIWGICMGIPDFSFFELEKPRNNLVIYDRYELEYLNLDVDKDYEQKDIYEHCPVEDTKLGIRGSCSSYKTRKNISDDVRNLSLSEANNKYGQKLVIVASQNLREQALIDTNVNPVLQLPLTHYCLLERIGRTRTIGEITIKKTSNIKEDAKTLFYIRKGLLEHGLIRKQIYYQGNTGLTYNGQNMGTLVHLTRFFNTRKPKVIVWAEHLINYLKSKENYAAEYNEVKNELNLDYSIKKFFKIHLLQKVFKTDVKVPYRSYYPNSVDEDWQCKSNSSKERILKLVTLADPNVQISDLWRTEEIKEDHKHCILDIKNQKFFVPFLQQAYKAIEARGYKGASQMELAQDLGLTKLISRSLVRNLVKSKVVSTYIDDIGRQRTTKFVSRKLDEKNSHKKQMEKEIFKMKEYSRTIQTNESKDKSNSDVNNEKNTHNAVDVQVKTPVIKNEIRTLPEDISSNNSQYQLLNTANQIFRKYKLFKNNARYRYTSSEKRSRLAEIKNCRKNKNTRGSNQKNLTSICHQEGPKLMESDFYKTIETKLIVQKPECKKKSKNVAIVGFMENVHNIDMQSNLSYKSLHRANMVIESVKQHKIIEDTQKLMKYINSEETKEGFDAKIDKNSLMRLLQKLAEDNFIKNIKLILKNKKQTKQKVINFICDPSIDENDALIQSAVEQAKLKFCLSAIDIQNPLENTDKRSTLDVHATAYKERSKTALKSSGIRRNNSIAKKYGYEPKFVRMRLMHSFLYYLIYDHPGHVVQKYEFMENLKKDKVFVGNALDDFTHLYSTELNWKMFISPLPTYRDHPPGWALMTDVHLRMPLSLFVKIINVNYEIPGLQELLDHPIKRHYLLKDVPTLIRNLLFFRRKYIFGIHEIVSRLCYIGLVQIGPQKLKEKDQVLVYLNRRTELLDTTSSGAGYHRIEDKPYPVTKFTFTSTPVVESYWYEMWNTCINTCLGGRLVVEGKDILLEDLARKPEMIQALKVREPEEAEKYDTGFVPGDRKGAAGIDSAFFAHLKRNWNWINNTSQRSFPSRAPSRRDVEYEETDESDKEVTRVKPRKAAQPRKQSSLPSKSTAKSSNSAAKSADSTKARSKQQQRDKSSDNSLPALVFPQATCSKPPKVIRKVLPRKPMRRRVKYDEIDFSALQRMDKLRVDWEQHEDNILLVCKVAMVYLCPNPRRNIITFSAIRDILRAYSFTSYNKTSKACQRRLLYMLKQPKTVNSVLLGVEEIKQDFYVNKRFGVLADKIRGECKNLEEYEQRVEKIFKDLVAYIARKYYNISNMEQREPVLLPKTVQEFNLYYQLKLPNRLIKSPGVSKEVREVSDIHTSTINSVIHSSMCCGRERRSWAYQLFKVYQQYPEYLLRNAMLRIRADKMVTMKKNYMCAYKKFGNCMPMSSSQYQLSSCYYYKFQTKWPYQLFSETYNILLTLLENYVARRSCTGGDGPVDGLEVKPDDGGIVAALHDFLSTNLLDIDIEIPDQIIMLNPILPQKHEAYQRIEIRYRAILEALGLNADNSKNRANGSMQAKNKISLAITNTADQTGEDSEQQSSVEVRSAKRLREDDDCFLRTKKQKLDNADAENEKRKSEILSLDDEIEAILGESLKKGEDFQANDIDENHLVKSNQHSSPGEPLCSEKNDQQVKPTTESTNMSLQNFSCNWLDGFQHIESSKSSDDNVHRNAQPSCGSTEVATPVTEQKTNLPKSNSDLSDLGSVKSIRVNELMRRENGGPSEAIAPEGRATDVRSQQTRIAMLRMREELHDLTFDDNHHAHECFVVNSCKLLYSLLSPADEEELMTYQGMQLPGKLLPVDIGLVNGILDSVKRHAVFPKKPMTPDELRLELGKAGSFAWPDVDRICKFVRSKAEFGATLHELVVKFDHLNDKLADILVLLTEKRIVLRAGIVAVRYIHHRYINPWIIHSYKILRLEKEAHQTIPEGSVYVLDGDDSAADKDKDSNRFFNAANLFYDPPIKSISNESLRKDNTNTDSVEHDQKDIDTQDNNNTSEKRKNEDQDDSQETKKRKTESVVDTKEDLNTQVDENVSNNEKTIDNDNSQESKEKNTDYKSDNRKSADAPIDENVSQEPNINGQESENYEDNTRLKRKRTVLLKQKDVYRAAKLLDFNTAEEIKVVIKPWIRIDGVLNRRVLDRMLGAVLCFCIEKPGLSLTTVQNRFTPAIQPYHTRELIEILFKLGCVKTTVQRIPKVTLFSKPEKLDLSGNPDLVADSDSYIIEPTTQASLRFGMFLSNKSYNLDFLSTL